MVKLGPKTYKSSLAMSMATKEWRPLAIHDIGGHLMAEYQRSQVTNIILDGKDNENKITLEIQKVQQRHLDAKLRSLIIPKKARAQRRPWPERSSTTGGP